MEFTDHDGDIPVKMLTPEEIIAAVCTEFKVDKEDVLSKKRTAEIVRSRQVIMYLCRKYTDMSLEEIGRTLNKKDHVVVMDGVNKIEKMMAADAQFSERIEHIIKGF